MAGSELRFVPVVILLLSACGTEPELPPGPEPPPSDVADTLAFGIDSSIYLIGVEEGAVPARVDSGYIYPSWSPDGGTLAMVFTGPRNPIIEAIPQALYLADPDGGNVRQLTGFGNTERIYGPALWAPDGSSLLFVRAYEGFGPDYQHAVRVAAAGGPETTVGPFGFAPIPSWSHDGTLLAIDADFGKVQVIDLGADTVVLEVLGSWPRFSPANDDLAFSEGTTGHIHLIRPDSTADRDLQVTGSPQGWSADGARLVFLGADGVYTVAGDGSGLLRIGPLNTTIGAITWSPDGKRMAYVSSPSSGPQTLYVASADDGDRRPLHTGDRLCCPAWKPREP